MSVVFNPYTCPLKGHYLIEASAGTGKTYTLTLLYLRLLLNPWLLHPDKSLPRLGLEQILVVTFTQAATHELRERIRLRLIELRQALELGDQNQSDVVELFGENSPPVELLDFLQASEQRIDEAAIFTIHSFCQRMLSHFRFETGCLQTPTLVEDDSTLKQQAIEDYWRTQIYTERPQRLDFIQQFCQTPQALLRYIQSWLSRPSPENLPQVCDLDTLIAEQELREQQFKQNWQREYSALYEAVVDQVQRYTSTFVSRYFDQIHAWVADDTSVSQSCLETALEKFAHRTLQTKKLRKHAQPPDIAFTRQIDEFLQYRAQQKLYFFAHAIEHCQKRFTALKHLENKQTYDDLLTHLDESLSSDQGHALAHVMSQRYPCALVDEFQDTDAVQYRIFRKIYLESSSAESLFLIGDPKQAIYSFRGADIFTYMRARSEIKQHYTLQINWRSTPALIQAMHVLFTDRQGRPSFLYTAIPYVQVDAGQSDEMLDSHDGAVDKPLTFWLAHSQTTEALRQELALGCASRIAALLSTKTFLKKRRVQAQDIAVLVRNRTQARVIQEALQTFGIAAAYLSNGESVFASQEARDVYRLLDAMLHLHDTRKLRAACATSLFQYSFAALNTLQHDDNTWAQEIEFFRQYAHFWSRQGILAMLRRLLFAKNISAALLAQPQGARRLTDVLHIGELLQQAQAKYDGEHALLKYFQEQIQQPNHQAKNQQRRLEGEQHLVQIVTIHKSKGLEYPLVFLPFSCLVHSQNSADPFYVYHDGLTLKASLEKIEHTQKERLAEEVRLLYVAMTRAICQLWVGVCATGKCDENPLASLLHLNASDWNTQTLDATLTQLASKHAQIAYLDLPKPNAAHQHNTPTIDEELYPRIMTKAADFSWKMTSYTELMRHQPALTQYTTQAPVDLCVEKTRGSECSIFTFPKGAQAGKFLHRIFETLDFNHLDALTTHIQTHLQASSFEMLWQDILVETVTHTLKTRLFADCRLMDLEARQKRIELEFVYNLGRSSIQDFEQCARQYDALSARAPQLEPEQLHGLLRGFIDLVFEWQGRYYILDYKSNYLGESAQDYDTPQLEAAMLAHRYDIQYQLYALALHRLLAWRLRDYCPSKHFGGVIYLFLRGQTAPSRGVFFTQIQPEFLTALDQLFDDDAHSTPCIA